MKRVIESSEEINAITLKKDSKGNYNWDIKVYGEDMEMIIDKIKWTDEKLREAYR